MQQRRALRVALRIGGDRDLEIADSPGVGDQVGGRAIAVGRGFIRGVEAGRRIAAQRHDMAHARAVIGAKGRANSSFEAPTQVRCAAGFIVVSRTKRSTVAWVRSRVEPPAP